MVNYKQGENQYRTRVLMCGGALIRADEIRDPFLCLFFLFFYFLNAIFRQKCGKSDGREMGVLNEWRWSDM